MYLIPAKEIYDRPAYHCTIELSIVGNDVMGISGGMGLPEGFLMLPDSDEEVTRFIESMDVARVTQIPVWRGFDIRHLYRQEHAARSAGERIVALDVLAALDAGSKWLTQEAFDFLTCKDVEGARIGSRLVGEDVASLFDYDMEKINLMTAFARQMTAEAEPCRHKAASGIYVMQHEPLPAVDNEIIYDTLRLYVTPHGIFCTVLVEGDYMPFLWTPDGINTSQIFIHIRGVFALDVMLSCIWRDACVVREGFASQRKGVKGYESKAKANKPMHRNPVVLPRTVYKSTWGAAEEREEIERIARQAHTVRAHYRELHEGWNASDAAAAKAEEYGHPLPPEGFTFVVPHIRGGGEHAPVPAVRRVVCKGLQVARIALGK